MEMEYSYTRRQTLNVYSAKVNLLSMILAVLAAISGNSAGAQGPCNLTVNVSSVDVSCFAGNDGSATVMVSGGASPYSFSWSMNASLTAPVAAGLSAGSYSVTVTDSMGCSVTAGFMIGQPSAPLTLSVSGIGPTCASGVDGSATASASGGTSPYSYSWNTNPVQVNATASGLAGGTYQVTVTDVNGCIALDSITLDPATPVTAVVTGQDTICQEQDYPQTILLIASGGTSYSWSTGSTTNGALVTPMTTTTYSVVVSNGTCADTAYFTVTAFVTPHPWISGPASACAGDPVTLTANTGTYFIWSTGETTASIVVSPTVTTTYTVTAVNGVCSGTTTQTVNVNSPSAEITGCVTPCAGALLVYETSVTGAAIYEWGVPSGWTIVSGQGTGTITVQAGDASSDGMIKLATSGTGCTTYTLSLSADVSECREDMRLANTFTPNSDGYNDTWEIPNIKNYPDSELMIVNRWGNEVFRMTNYDNSWDGTGLPEGTYFYSLKITASGSENGCATGSEKGAELKGYITIIR
jgi:gliding motility-associated-like protein